MAKNGKAKPNGKKTSLSETDVLKYRLNLETLRRMEAELAAQRSVCDQSMLALKQAYKLEDTDTINLETGAITRAQDAAPK